MSGDESLLLFRGLHILGGAHNREACQPLLRLLRRPYEDVDLLLGDTVTESLAKIVAGVFDGDTVGLLTLVADSSIDGFIREALFGAATFLAWEHRIERDRLKGFLVRFREERPAEEGDQAWVGWLRAIALLGVCDLVPLVDKAFREDRIPEWIDRSQFDEDLADAESAPNDIDRFTQVNLGYIKDVLESLDWTRGSEDDVFEGGDEKSPWADFVHPNEPVRNPWRHVGRNDPYPCGSGKKAKKCCLANGEPPA